MGKVDVKALRGVSIEVEKGEYLAIMGPSGSGKSTLMNILGCLDTPTKGRYFLEGKDVSSLSDDDLALIRNQKIGFVFQSFHLLPRTPAIHNVELPLIYAGLSKKERRKKAEEALEIVGLKDRMYHKPNELSGGERQRVAIARAIVTRPSILLADEPTGNLDSKAGEEIMKIFEELHSHGNTIIVVTHDPNIASRTERIIKLKDGQVVND
ncbi:MAG: ABC transporter ATP-binding protein [Candidatus Aminicenantes bacterium]|nr:ABC transporter ATP-binding protein [Candidatus Aminicenantes bacterium]